MTEVGIIVNPASGKDIRRVIANGTVVTNQEKINMVIRMVMAMDSAGVDRVLILPDPTHMGQRIIAETAPDLCHTQVDLLDLKFLRGTATDSLIGARMFREREVSCMVVLGGDGTSRVVARESGAVPLIPVSTGTNNVFPKMIEGTLVGLAAAQIAAGRVSGDDGCRQVPVLELRDADGNFVDSALVDIAVLNARDLGSRAVWETDSIRQLFLTSASPASIGLSSIGGWLQPLPEPGSGSPKALHVQLSPEGKIRVKAPVAPGLMREVRVSEYATFGTEECIRLTGGTGVVALDGEREVLVREDQPLWVRLNPAGPFVVDVPTVLERAAERGAGRVTS